MRRVLLLTPLVLVPVVWFLGCDETPTGPGVDPLVADAPTLKQVSPRSFQMIDLGFEGYASGINERRQVVGTDYEQGGVLWDDGHITYLPSQFDEAVSINNRGQIVGNDGTGAVWIWRKGTTASDGPNVFNPLPLEYLFATSINGNGQVVGYAYVCTDCIEGPDPAPLLDPIAWVWNKTGGRELFEGCEHAYSSRALDINERGQIVGSCWEYNVGHIAMRWEGSRATVLGVIGTASGINDRGQIVGTVERSAGQSEAFLWERGKVANLESLGGNSGASRINNRAQAVGWSRDRAGKTHAVLWVGGSVTDLAGDCVHSGARDINARGQIVGECDGRAVMWLAR